MTLEFIGANREKKKRLGAATGSFVSGKHWLPPIPEGTNIFQNFL